MHTTTEGLMEQKAIDILDQNNLMGIATNRPDGWPQATMVGYANDGLLLYFIISRASQKFANIARDDRVSIVVGRNFEDPATIKSLSIAAHASEVTDPQQRKHAIDLLLGRHPGLRRLERPPAEHSAIMRAYPAIVAGSENDRADGDLTLSFADPDPHAIHISWEEFFAMFETQALRFRYQDPGDTGETPEWAFSFESRDTATDASDETVLPEDIEDIDTNLFPSSPAVDHPSPDLREDLEAGEEL